MASLIVLDDPQKDDYYPLGRRTTVIGRDEALMIQILDEPYLKPTLPRISHIEVADLGLAK